MSSIRFNVLLCTATLAAVAGLAACNGPAPGPAPVPGPTSTAGPVSDAELACLDDATGFDRGAPQTTDDAVVGFARGQARCGVSEAKLVDYARQVAARYPHLELGDSDHE